MFSRLRSFLTRHPAVRDALLWAIPAILFGAALRLLLLNYQPYTFYGADSRSYFKFANDLLTSGAISLNEKRRFLYPILMVPIAALPGTPMVWLAWLQHAFGLATLVPLAYVARKTFAHWRLWIIPVTVIYAGFPLFIWYEHELLGENVFYALFLWSFAGWVAWISEQRKERALRLFWCFFIPFALFILTKPSGRFAWPGIGIGLLVVAAWRRLDWKRIVAIVALMVVTLFVGAKKQGAWLFYVATFPLTQTETPLHADYKAEIRGKVKELRDEIDTYYLQDRWVFNFLESPDNQDDWPLWKTLDDPFKSHLFMDLAVEGIKAEPGLFAWGAVSRVIHSANPSYFKGSRFNGVRYVEKFEHLYEEARGKEQHPVRLAFGIPKKAPLIPYEEFKHRLAPAPDGWAARTMQAYNDGFESVSDLVRLPTGSIRERVITKARPTFLGWWLIAGLLLSLLPRYRLTLGVWMIVAVGYLYTLFLVSQINPRYFAVAWPVFVPLLALPADVLVSLAVRAFGVKRPA